MSVDPLDSHDSHHTATIAALKERVENLTAMRSQDRCDSERRHQDNRALLNEQKVLLNQILDQTRITNGQVNRLKSWTESHEVITGQRVELLNDTVSKVAILEQERQQRKGAIKLLVVLWAAISALFGLLAGYLGKSIK